MTPAKARLRALAGVAATLFFLWLALRGVEWAEVGRHLREANFPLLAAAVLVSTLGVHVRALRLKVLLAPVAPDVAFTPRVAATAIGFAVNNLLPARVGEFARAFVLGRLGRIPVSAAFASLVMERMLDGFACVVLLFGTMGSASFPVADSVGGVDPRALARAVMLIAAVMGIVLFVMAMFPERSAGLFERVAGRILPASFRRPLVDALRAFLGGLGVLRSPKLMALSVVWVMAQWFFLAASLWLAFLAFGITEPGYLGAVFMQSLINIATAIPSAPGFFGTYEWAARNGLALWGVDAERAVSFAIGIHLGGYLTVTLLGLWYLWRLNLSWKEVGKSEERVEEAVERDIPPPGAAAG